MLRPKVTTLPGHIQAVYVQNVVKLYASILQQKERAADAEAAQELTQLLVERLPQFVQSADLEVQERVRAGRGLLGAQAAPTEDGGASAGRRPQGVRLADLSHSAQEGDVHVVAGFWGRARCCSPQRSRVGAS